MKSNQVAFVGSLSQRVPNSRPLSPVRSKVNHTARSAHSSLEFPMSTRHLVDPEQLPIIEALPFLKLTLEGLQTTRETLVDTFKVMLEAIPDGVPTKEVDIPSPGDAHSV